MQSSDSDQALALRAGQGDEKAFDALFRKYHDRVYAVVYRFTGRADEAEELSQQVWIKLWKNVKTYRGDSKFFTWLYRVVTFHCLDAARKSKRQPDWVFPDAEDSWDRVPFQPGPVDSPDQVLHRKEIMDRFHRALEQLKPVHKMALLLREIEGLTYDEIAETMNCRRGTVMSRLHYARQSIQTAMKDVKE